MATNHQRQRNGNAGRIKTISRSRTRRLGEVRSKRGGGAAGRRGWRAKRGNRSTRRRRVSFGAGRVEGAEARPIRTPDHRPMCAPAPAAIRGLRSNVRKADRWSRFFARFRGAIARRTTICGDGIDLLDRSVKDAATRNEGGSGSFDLPRAGIVGAIEGSDDAARAYGRARRDRPSSVETKARDHRDPEGCGSLPDGSVRIGKGRKTAPRSTLDAGGRASICRWHAIGTSVSPKLEGNGERSRHGKRGKRSIVLPRDSLLNSDR